jgi:hypothetical protein
MPRHPCPTTLLQDGKGAKEGKDKKEKKAGEPEELSEVLLQISMCKILVHNVLPCLVKHLQDMSAPTLP